jgi:hypothetical protein
MALPGQLHDGATHNHCDTQERFKKVEIPLIKETCIHEDINQ